MEAFIFLLGLALLMMLFAGVGFVTLLKLGVCYAAAAWINEKILCPLLLPKRTPQMPSGAFVRYVPDEDDDGPPPPDEPRAEIPPPPPPGKAIQPPRPPHRRGRHTQRTCH